jgi:CubicO group peptidase (beta-lactamase class C family)
MKLCFLLLHLLLFQCCFSQLYFFADSAERMQNLIATKEVVDKLYRQQAEKHHFPGMVYGVVADGKLIYTGAAGFADVEKKTSATSTTVFRMASMSKSFTALAILKLRDEGKLQLDEPASKYISELKKAKPLTSDAPVITIRHLLTHAAGFPEDNPWGDRQLDASDKELLELAGTAVFSTTPGTTYEYSNVGFALLGRIITVVSKTPYQQYITQHILKPLGMNNTYWEWTKVPSAQLAHGYRRAGNEWKEEALLHDGAYGAMGGLMTTLTDFEKYMALHLSAWPARDGKENSVIKRSSLREMQAAHNFSGLNTRFAYARGRPCATASAYGYGLRWIQDCAGKTFVGHSGGLPGFGSNWNILPDYGIGVVCFANVTYAPTGTFNLSVLDTIVQLAQLKPRSITPSNILQQRKEQLAELLPGWKKHQNIFAENFFLDNDLAYWQKQSATMFEKIGSIRKVHPIMPQNNLRGSFIIEGEKGKLQVYFTLTPEVKPLIQELQIGLL